MATGLNKIIGPSKDATKGEAAPTSDDSARTDETSEEQQTGEENKAPPAKEEKKEPEEPKVVPLKAYEEERRKRQEAERAAAEAHGRAQAFEKVSTSRPAPAKTREELEAEYLADPIGFLERREAANRKNEMQDRIAMSEEIMRDLHPDDYDVAVDAFEKAARQEPALLGQMCDHRRRLPAKFAYDYGKNLIAVGGAKSVNDLRAQIETEVRAKVEAEYAKKLPPPPTPSNTGARGSGSPSGAFTGPTPLGSIIGPRKAG